MAPCETYREQLLDFLYGLLDEGEKIALEAHLSGCAECQSALGDAQRQQALFNRAAHIVCEVAPFSLPGLVATEASAPSTLVVEETPATLPLTARPSKRSHLRRFWPAWTAAAAILAVAIGLQQMYQGGHAEREQAVTASRKEIEKIDGEFAALKVNTDKEKLTALRDLGGTSHVHAMGPTTYHPAVPAECRVTTRSLEGKPAKADVKLDVTDAATGEVLYHKKITSEGEARLPLPEGLDLKRPAKLRLEAKAGETREVFEETLTPAPRVYATHLALNKNTFRVGEVMFFRTVTLDRVSHQPPKESIPLRFSLVNDAGKPVVEVAATTGPGGISAGNLALTDELAGGNYTLHVRPEDSGKEHVLGIRQPVEVTRESLDIEFDRARYKAGDVVTITGRARSPGKKKDTVTAAREGGKDDKAEKAITGANPYDVRIVVDGKPVPALNAGAYAADFSQKLNADALGNTLLQFKLPPKIERGDAYVELERKTGKSVERIVQPVPVAPSHVIANFYPEAGRLVPGVHNKVYFNLESPSGAPVDAALEINSSKGLVYRSEKQSWGFFTFTPHGKEKYDVTLRSSALPGGKLDLNNALDKVEMASDGVALHVKEPVAKAGTPIEVVLRNPGPPRAVLLVAACRGVVFDQQALALAKGDNTALVAAPDAIDGLLRVTLLEAPGRMVEGRSLVRPLAERLVFRAPARKLDVTCTLDKSGPLNPGQNVSADIDVRDESGKPATSWIGLSIVDQRVCSPFSESNMHAFFNVASDIATGDDLDQAVLALNDTRGKDAPTALDLFLSVHGYRRFAPVGGEHAELAKVEEEAKKVGDKTTVTERKGESGGYIPLPIFSRENRSLFEGRLAFRRELTDKLAQDAKLANGRRVELQAERERAVLVARDALENLAKFEALPTLYGRLALTVLILACLALGGGAILWGAYRWARAASPRLSFSVSMACLACAFGLYFLGRQEATVGSAPGGWLVAIRYDSFIEPNPVFREMFKTGDAPTILGPFALKAEERLRDETENVMEAGVAPLLAKRLAAPVDATATTATTIRQEQVQTTKLFESLTRDKGGSYTPVPIEPLFQNEEMQERFKAAKDVQKQFDEYSAARAGDKEKTAEGDKKDKKKETTAETKNPLPPPMSTPKDDARKGDADENEGRYLLVREYAYRSFPLRPDFQDTVLWHPALVAENGKASVSFDLSPDVPAYRVLFFAHSASGRLGFYERRLEVRPAAARK